MILIQGKVGPKTTSVIRGGPMHREKKKKLQGLGRSRRNMWIRVLKD